MFVRPLALVRDDKRGESGEDDEGGVCKVRILIPLEFNEHQGKLQIERRSNDKEIVDHLSDH